MPVKQHPHPPLWTKDFILAFMSYLFMFFSFYVLLPVLPFYVATELGAMGTAAGIILALYTASALVVRPFSGYLVDTLPRRKLFVVSYLIFCIVFSGYLLPAALLLFIGLRISHGLIFGIVSVSNSTIAIDVTPSERRGEGIGYFGMASSIAMALGPMTGLFAYEHASFTHVFYISLCTSAIGLLCVLFIKTPKTEPIALAADVKKISLDRFILVKGLRIALVILLSAVAYGVLTNYLGMYSKSIGLDGAAGLFFSVQASGVIIARLLSSRMINRGKIAMIIIIGLCTLLFGFSLFTLSKNLGFYYTSALFIGMGYGFVSPAFQTMFVNLAEHNQRGTANSTYFTSWDMGIGLGIALGGSISHHYGFTKLFILCLVFIVISLFYFIKSASPFFEKNKLR